VSRKPKMYLAFSAVVALLAVVPATSLAANFQFGGGQNILSKSLERQQLTVKAGPVKCWASGSGVPATSGRFDLTVTYSGCTAFGFANVNVSPASYRYNADGELDLLNEVTIKVLGAGCTFVLKPQSNLSSVAYSNNGPRLISKKTISGITYTSSGGLCGASGSDATLTGDEEMEQVNGGIYYTP
jgi:hypothetical protein